MKKPVSIRPVSALASANGHVARTPVPATLAAAARQYAGRGWAVFPVYSVRDGSCTCGNAGCRNVAKHPHGRLVPHGVTEATIDSTTVDLWWRREQDANVAIATGPRSGVVVLDSDPRHGGDASLRDLVAQHGPLPKTLRVRTGGGGDHFYFTVPTNGTVIRNATDLAGHRGLDVRGAGGFVVAPPSLHASGAVYEWDVSPHAAPLASIPDWLLALMTRPPAPADAGDSTGQTDRDWLGLLQGVPEGNRHGTAVKIAGHYFGLGRAREEVEALLLGFASQCTPAHEPEDIKRIVNDLSRAEEAKVRAGMSGGELTFTPLHELLHEPEEQVAWVVEGLLPSGGLSVIVGKPKAGKSTLVQSLAFSVARGDSWLGRATTKGVVLYLALEEKRSELRRHFAAMGATDEPILVYCAAAPKEGVALLRKATDDHRPALIVVDPLFRFTRVKKVEDYAECTAALESLMTLARETGAHVLVVHHSPKGKRESLIDSILGSTAIAGGVDTALFLKRSEHYRTLSTAQRYGADLEEVTVTLDPTTRTVDIGGTREQADEDFLAGKLITYLKGQPHPVTEPTIHAAVEGRVSVKERVLRKLAATGLIAKNGTGRKNDPFTYWVPPDPPPVPNRTAFSVRGEDREGASRGDAQTASRGTENAPSRSCFSRREGESEPGASSDHRGLNGPSEANAPSEPGAKSREGASKPTRTPVPTGALTPTATAPARVPRTPVR